LTKVDDIGNKLTAAAKLNGEFQSVVEKNVPVTSEQFLTEVYSLSLLFPLEFNDLKQTGTMDFTLSLYELNKRRPDVFNERIRRVQVSLTGLRDLKGVGFTGRIIHRGSFLLRDKDTTPSVGPGRFIPTDQQLAEAFQQLGNGASQGISIGGVMPFLLKENVLAISSEGNPPDLGDPSPQALNIMEGYGAAGNWRLEIENVDLRNLGDALLIITYIIPMPDLALAERVKGLIRAFEQELSGEGKLDLITTFSLNELSSSGITQLLSGQPLTISLQPERFPAGITDLKVKAVLVQALDSEETAIKGVTIHIERQGTKLNQTSDTQSDGFNGDIKAISFLSQEDRFPVEGTYTLQLPKPSQAAKLDKLLLFFVYEFQNLDHE
jgi:hypothetical protein